MKDFSTILLCLAAAMTISCTGSHPEVEVYPIQDNVEPRMMSIALFPEAPDSLIDELGIEDGIPSSVCAFLVKTGGKEILFDAANGAPDSQLLPTLEQLEVKPEDIDHIFITHLHGDHFGGLLKDDSAAFPGAVLHINSVELDSWLSMPEEQTARLRQALGKYEGRIQTFSPEEELPCGIKAVPAYGHTAGHTMYRIGNIMIAGDIMHGTALQMEHPEFCARFDMDKENAIAARKALVRTAEEEKLMVYGMHFPSPYYIDFTEQTNQ